MILKLSLVVAVIVCVEWRLVSSAAAKCTYPEFLINGNKVPFEACVDLQNWPTLVGSGSELNIIVYYSTQGSDLHVGVQITGGSKTFGSLSTLPYYFGFAYGALMSGSCATILYGGNYPESKWEVGGLNISAVPHTYPWPRWDDIMITDWPAKLIDQELIASNKPSVTSTTLLYFTVPLEPPCGSAAGGITPVIWSSSKLFPVTLGQPDAAVPHQFYGYGSLEVAKASLPSPSKKPPTKPTIPAEPSPAPSKAPVKCKYGDFEIKGKTISFDSCTQLQNWPTLVGSGSELNITLHYSTKGSDLHVGVTLTGGSRTFGSLNTLPYYFGFAYGALMAGSCATILHGGNYPQSKWEVAGLNISAVPLAYPWPRWDDIIINDWPAKLVQQELIASNKISVTSTTLLYFIVPIKPPCGSVAGGITPVIWSSSKLFPVTLGQPTAAVPHQFYGYGTIEISKRPSTRPTKAPTSTPTTSIPSLPPSTEQPTASTTPSFAPQSSSPPSISPSPATAASSKPSASATVLHTESAPATENPSMAPSNASGSPTYLITYSTSPDSCSSQNTASCSASCDYGFKGYRGSVPSFTLKETADASFTTEIVSLNSSESVGVVGGSEEALILRCGRFVPISSYDDSNLTQPFSPSFFKSVIGGVAHEEAQGNQIDALSGACVILPLNGVQLLDKLSQVIDNSASSSISKTCVVFKLE
mmetsp:Transcript_13147/g.26670  ORF Transcript_13147/g.26670 Transcript_13147/m.26670 type:complete len:701 (-) Transcript_13147:179-2281(-)